MKNIFLLIALSLGVSACDAVNAAKDANANTREANDKLSIMLEETRKLSEGIHLQELKDSLKEMLAKENIVVPDNPSKMIPFGIVFAEKATAEELAKFVEVTLTDINLNRPGDHNKVDGKVPPELIAEMEHHKIAVLTALQVVMGFAPQAKIEEMVRTQIVNQGRYERAALQGLMLRAMFIYSYRYDIALHQKEILNLAELEEAIELTEYLEYIVRLPFAQKIAVKARMLVKAHNVDVALDPRMTVAMWDDLAKDVTDRVFVRMQSEGSNPTPSALAAQAKIQSYQRYWQSRP